MFARGLEKIRARGWGLVCKSESSAHRESLNFVGATLNLANQKIWKDLSTP